MRGIALAFVAVAVGATVGGCGWGLVSEYAGVKLTNDMPYSVDLQLCRKDDCTKMGGLFSFEDQYVDSLSVKPHEETSEPRVKYGFVAVYRVVRSSDGKELGCLPFASPKPSGTLVARVSQRVPCAGGWNKDARWPS